jgi:hypothetical protein
MARTSLPLTNLKVDNGIDIAAGAVIDQSNGMRVPINLSVFPPASDCNLLMLLVETTNGADVVVTVKVGVDPPAFHSERGDLAVTAHAATGGCVIGPFISARFAQSDNSINVDFASGTTGWITAYMLPKT